MKDLSSIRCLSIRQPWAWLIVAGHKTVENRSWRTSYRGPVLIQAGKQVDQVDLHWLRESGVTLACDLPTGGIVGMTELVDVVEASSSLWFYGPFGYVLRDARLLPFVPERGQLGFFRPSPAALAAVAASL